MDPSDTNEFSQVYFEAFDVNGNLLEMTKITNIDVSQWSDDFVGIERSEGIAKIAFDGNGAGVLRIDDLTWDALPEPSVAAAFGILVLLPRRRYGRICS